MCVTDMPDAGPCCWSVCKGFQVVWYREREYKRDPQAQSSSHLSAATPRRALIFNLKIILHRCAQASDPTSFNRTSSIGRVRPWGRSDFFPRGRIWASGRSVFYFWVLNIMWKVWLTLITVAPESPLLKCSEFFLFLKKEKKDSR